MTKEAIAQIDQRWSLKHHIDMCPWWARWVMVRYLQTWMYHANHNQKGISPGDSDKNNIFPEL
jgi:hypothetical protein